MLRVRFACAALVCLHLLPAVAHADEASAVATLKAKGIVKTGSLALAEDAELAKKLRDDFKLKKAWQLAEQELEFASQNAKSNEQAVVELNKQLILANQSGDAAANNQIIAELNLREIRRKELSGAETTARGKANKAREDYVTYVVETRRLADKVQNDYKLLAADKDVQKAVEELNQATGKTFALAESKSLAASLKALKKIEDRVLSDEIPLTRHSNTFSLHAVINNKYQKEMMLDSGASLISLPDKVAKEINLEIPSDAETIKLKLADGRIIDGKLVKLKSVRVGKFEVDDVDCAVLGPDYPGAEPLLGMSFLQNFSFKIDADVGKLTMNKIEEPAAKSTTRRGKLE